MKLSHLKQICIYLKQFSKISAIYRVDDTILKVAFDKDHTVYFNMQRSNSNMFMCKDYTRSKVYNAPFDVVLAKRLNRANIIDISLVNNDKILRLKCSVSSAYKEEISFVHFEFTGKYTNVIVLDQNNIVLEALRHVDLFSSFREVRVGQKLLEIPNPPFEAKEYPLENVEAFLYETYLKDQEQKLNSLKQQKVNFLQKKLKKLQKRYKSLDDVESLLKESELAQERGNLVLANLHKIKPYQQEIELEDYDGSLLKIKLEKNYANVSQISQDFFTKSKKAKQRAKNLHIEKDSLESKIEHLNLFIHTVQEAKDISKISLLFPKKEQTKKIKQNDSIEVFFIEGYKVSLGKNEKGNIDLLQAAKARDIWLHLKERPSCHVIISTDKQNVPEHIIHAAARICVDFTTTSKDRYLVDYTPRREVSIQHGANVLYNKYKTIEVDNRS